MMVTIETLGFWQGNHVVVLHLNSIITFIHQHDVYAHPDVTDDEHYDDERMACYTFLSHDGRIIRRDMTEKQVSHWFETIT